MCDKCLVRHTVTIHIHLMFKVRVYYLCGIGPVCEGGTARREAKALVWKRNCSTPGRSIFLVWKWNYGTSKHYSLCGSGIADLKSHNNLCAEAKLRNLKSKYIPIAEAELRHRVTSDKEYSVCGIRT